MSYFYYLATSLTPLEFPDKPELTFSQLIECFEMNFSKDQMKHVYLLRKYFDVLNIKAHLENASLDDRGNISNKEFEKVFNSQDYFDEYVWDILNKCETTQEKLQEFPKILSAFFQQEIDNTSGFVKWLFEFERNCSLVLVGYRAKKQKRDAAKELEFEDPTDPVVSQILMQKDSPHFEAPSGYEEFQEMLLSKGLNPFEQYSHHAEYRIRKIKEQMENQTFTLDWFLGYLVLFVILEEYHDRDEAKGKEILNSICKDTEV